MSVEHGSAPIVFEAFIQLDDTHQVGGGVQEYFSNPDFINANLKEGGKVNYMKTVDGQLKIRFQGPISEARKQRVLAEVTQVLADDAK